MAGPRSLLRHCKRPCIAEELPSGDHEAAAASCDHRSRSGDAFPPRAKRAVLIGTRGNLRQTRAARFCVANFGVDEPAVLKGRPRNCGRREIEENLAGGGVEVERDRGRLQRVRKVPTSRFSSKSRSRALPIPDTNTFALVIASIAHPSPTSTAIANPPASRTA
jgi:hypothetical protein